MMEPVTYDEIIGAARVWPGELDPTVLHDHAVAARNRLADAAKAGDWAAVGRLLDDEQLRLTPYQWRPDGTSWFTPLHQAAWHGAPVPVAIELIRRGALRSLCDAQGRTAFDVAVERKQPFSLREQLRPPEPPLGAEHIAALDRHLGEVIDGRIKDTLFNGRDPRQSLRYLPVGILHELPGRHVWFPVPGMYRGFQIELRRGYLEVESWCRVVGGSGQAHLITRDGAILVDEGFV